MNSQLTLIMLMELSLKVRAIVVPDEYVRVEDPNNRQLINPYVEEAASTVNELSRSVGCSVKFVESYMNQLPSRVTVLLMDTDDPDFSSVYLSKLQQVRTTYILNGDLDFDLNVENQNSSLDALVILKNFEQLANSTAKLVDLCGRDCRYGVMVTNLFTDEESFMDEAVNYVSQLWVKKVANVVILGAVGDGLLAAQSQGFKAHEWTEPSQPILIGKCYNNEWTNSTEIFPVLKMNNSIIHFAIIEHEPYMNFVNVSGHTRARGIEATIIYILRDALHFQPFGSIVDWADGTTVEDEVLEEFESDRKIDFVVGGLLRSMMREADFALPYDVTQVVWLVPIHSNLSFQGLISPFSMSIWIMTIASIIFGGLIKFLLFSDMSYLEIWSLVIGVAWHKQPKKLPYRIKFISWVLFGYILTQVYLASLAGQLLASADKQIDTLEDLVDSDIIIGGTSDHRKYFKESNHENRRSIIQMIYDRFVVFSYRDYTKKLGQLLQGENSSLALVAVLNISAVSTDHHPEKYHVVKEVLATSPLAFPAWKGLPYLTQIDAVLEALTQGGIISFIARNETSVRDMYDANEDEDDTTLELNDIAPNFLLLALGHVVGIVCLLGELAVKWWYNRRDRTILRKREEVRRVKVRKRVRFDAEAIDSIHGNGLRQRVLRPNVTIGYYDTRVPWKLL